MKLKYYGNFAFSGETKNGMFTINPSKKNETLLFSVFTGQDRDMNFDGNFLSWPGEYEFGGTAAQLFELHNKSLGVKLLTEDVRVVFLPALDKELTENDMEILGNVDVLVLEVNEVKPALKKMVEEIDPKAVIVVGTAQEKFLAEMGAGSEEAIKEFVCTTSSLPSDKTIFPKLTA